MKKIQFLPLILSVAMLFSSCGDDSIKKAVTIDTKYIIEEEDGYPLFHIKAKNLKGFCEIEIPNGTGEANTISIPNEQLKEYIERFIKTKPEIRDAIKKLNYINYRSNDNLIISYNTEKGEMLIPDMLKEDGSLKRSLKLRKSYDRFYPRINEELGVFVGIPIIGELPPNFSICHKTSEAGSLLVYVDSATFINFATILPQFGLPEEITLLIESIAKQYSSVDDEMEIGIYLKKSINL